MSTESGPWPEQAPITMAVAVSLYTSLFGGDEIGVAADEEVIVHLHSTHFRAAVSAILGDGEIPHPDFIRMVWQAKGKRTDWLDKHRDGIEKMGELLSTMGMAITMLARWREQKPEPEVKS